MIMNRKQVYAVLDHERDYQMMRWGRDGQQIDKTVGEYLVYMQIYLTKAMESLTAESGSAGALDRLRKVIALGVACAEDNGLPAREPGPVINGHTNIISYLPMP